MRGLALPVFAVFAALLTTLAAQPPTVVPAPPAAPVAPAPAATDWSKDVEKACTSSKYGLRLAASKKVAEAGEAAVPALCAFAKDKGWNAVPVALVEAFADKGGNGEAVIALLLEWAQDRDFYWRAQALRGLAIRSKDKAIAARTRDLFARSCGDPAWLFRVYARLGACNAWPDEGGSFHRTGPFGYEPDADPRAATKFATLYFDVDILIRSIGDERTFLGDPWGKRRALEAFKALQQWAGSDCGYKPDAPFADNAAAIEAFRKRAEHYPLLIPSDDNLHLTDPATPFTGGIEVFSCKNGDYFLRWRDDGELTFGLEGHRALRLPAAVWQKLLQERATLTLPAQTGVVICDRIRLRWSAPDLHSLVAPDALPAPATEWLKHLAQAIEEADAKDEAAALRARLDQFAAH